MAGSILHALLGAIAGYAIAKIKEPELSKYDYAPSANFTEQAMIVHSMDVWLSTDGDSTWWNARKSGTKHRDFYASGDTLDRAVGDLARKLDAKLEFQANHPPKSPSE